MSSDRLVPRQIPVGGITGASGSLICEDAVPCDKLDAFPEFFYYL
ncbi:MAG TPA: hypothetical protein VFE41_06510 [Acetobacteraceae bacterium]|jgi:hypothetical protein|nr:hypothetical protein [Acetobacteraceae bacterium]